MNKTVKDLKVEIETDVGFPSVCSDYHWIIEELLWAYSCNRLIHSFEEWSAFNFPLGFDGLRKVSIN